MIYISKKALHSKTSGYVPDACSVQFAGSGSVGVEVAGFVGVAKGVARRFSAVE